MSSKTLDFSSAGKHLFDDNVVKTSVYFSGERISPHIWQQT